MKIAYQFISAFGVKFARAQEDDKKLITRIEEYRWIGFDKFAQLFDAKSNIVRSFAEFAQSNFFGLLAQLRICFDIESTSHSES